MKLNYFKYLRILLIIFLIQFQSCQSDDGDQINSQNFNHKNHSTVKTISGKDIPEILQIIKEESNKDFGFSINSSQGSYRFKENKINGTLDTDQIRQVTDSEGKSNYTFSMTKEGEITELSIINFVLKETEFGFYSYFLEFFPDENWLLTTSNPNDLSVFTGKLKVYDRYGIYVGENEFIDGIRTFQAMRTSCPDDTNDDTPGGGDENPSNGDGPGNSDSSDSGESSDGSDGTAGHNIEIEIVCGCSPGHEGGNSNDSCSCTDTDIIITINFADGNDDPIARTYLRNPCPPIEDDCNSQNDCEYGFDLSCNCLPNPSEEENADDGVIIDLVDVILGDFLVDELEIDGELAIWIRNLDYEQKLDVQLFLEENEYADEAKYGVNITANLSLNNLLESGYSQEFLDAVNCYNGPVLITSPNVGFKYYNYIRSEIAIIKQSEYPEDYDFSDWELIKIATRAHKNLLQLGLDIVGLIPGFGEVADIANGLIYTINGDGVNAAFSFASAVPFVGWFSTTAKWAKRTITLANGRKTTLKWIVNAGNVINFGSSSQLRRVLGISDSAFQAHHIIPWNKRVNEIIQKAAKADNPFHMNEALNGVAIQAWRNQPNHHIYDVNVQNLLETIPTNLNPNQTAQALEEIIVILRGVIENNPNLHLNELIF